VWGRLWPPLYAPRDAGVSERAIRRYDPVTMLGSSQVRELLARFWPPPATRPPWPSRRRAYFWNGPVR